MAAGLTISRAAERAGVGVETIRFYERRGLIRQPPRPRGGGYRAYDEDVVERIRFIRQAQDLGFSLREIEELLSLRADPAADCGDVRGQAVVKRASVNRKIEELRRIRSALDHLIATCPGGGALRTCTIMDALNGRRNAGVRRRASEQRERPPRLPRASRARNVTRTFKIDGMHCDSCARTIEAVVLAEPGVRKASVSYQNREARVLFEPSLLSEDRLVAAIGDAGFSVSRRST